ncbi:MAG TPA: hypothetical protein DIS76_04205 [Rhodospirillaceae bacterium]|nr:hypothetical protein [Rhodospirillaceae bacterium]
MQDITSIDQAIIDNHTLFPFNKSEWENNFWPRLERQGVTRAMLAVNILEGGKKFSGTYNLSALTARDAVMFLVQTEEMNGTLDPAWGAHFFPYDPDNFQDAKKKLEDLWVIQGSLGWGNPEFAQRAEISHAALWEAKKRIEDGGAPPFLGTYVKLVRAACKDLQPPLEQTVQQWLEQEAEFFPCSRESKARIYGMIKGLGLSFSDIADATDVEINSVNNCFRRDDTSKSMFLESWHKVVNYVRARYDDAFHAYGDENEEDFRELLLYHPDSEVPQVCLRDLHSAMVCNLTLGGLLDKTKISGVPQCETYAYNDGGYPIVRVMNDFYCPAIGLVSKNQVLLLKDGQLKIFKDAPDAYQNGYTMGGHGTAARRVQSFAEAKMFNRPNSGSCQYGGS